ncbi:MAG TPA: hypothetical protein VEA78_01860 [Acidimicrobiales bacterium]|nr:hypothetical protein [Acidimicrobiales bacterium]
MASSGVRLSSDGRLVVVRTSPPEDREALLATVERLRLARDIGAEVVAVVDDGTAVEVSLAFAGRVPDVPLAGADAATLGAKVAALLADLHTIGLRHGSVAVDHVLVDADGAVRLCGFGRCTPGDGTDDVRALGDVLAALVADGDRSSEATAVRAVAQRARGEAAPTAAAIAASLASIASAPRVDVRVASTSRRSRRRWPFVVPVAAACALVVAVAWPSSGTEPTSMATSTTVTTSTSTTSTSVAARRVWPSTPPTIVGAGATWRFGDAGDVAHVGSWDCGGAPTPALVRADGTVWLAPDWSTPSYVTTIDDEVLDVTVEHVDGCDVLVVTTPSGPVRLLA